MTRDKNKMAVMQPLPDKPTNTDLANGIQQLHACLEEHRETSAKLNLELKEEISKLKDIDVKDLKNNQTTLLAAFKLVDTDKDQPKPHGKTLALMTPIEAFTKFGGGLSALFLGWKLINLSWPFFIQWLEAINSMVVK